MISFVSYKYFSHFTVYAADLLTLELFKNGLLITPEIGLLRSWDDIESLALNDSLFGADSYSVLDCSTLSLDSNSAGYISTLSQQNLDKTILVIDREETEISTSNKKLLKQFGIPVSELKKPSSSEITQFMNKYVASENFDLPPRISSLISTKSDTYDQVMTLVYMAQMTDNDIEGLKSYDTVENTALFMLPWRINSLASDALQWYKNVDQDHLQLALSLLMTKTLKWKDSPHKSQVIASIIETDQDIKNYVRSDMNRFHSLLWQVRNEITL